MNKTFLNKIWNMIPDFIQHSLVAAAFLGIIGGVWALFGLPHGGIVGAIAGIMFYYGREVRDSENANPKLYDHIKVLLPIFWKSDSKSDLASPVISNIIIAILLELLL